MVVVCFLGALGASLAWEVPFELWIMWGFVGGALTLMFYLGTASQAGRFFVEARRSGLIELMLAAPLALTLFLLTVGLALLTRAAPQLNLYSVGLPVQVLAGLGGLLLLAPELLAFLAAASGRLSEFVSKII